jgi:hypothetical protein
MGGFVLKIMERLNRESFSYRAVQDLACEGIRMIKHPLAIGILSVAGTFGYLNSPEAQAATLAVIDVEQHGAEMVSAAQAQLNKPILKAECQADCNVRLIKVENNVNSVAHGVEEARINGAAVILIARQSSAYNDEPSQTFKNEVATTTSQGTPVVMSAGNFSSDDPKTNLMGFSNQPHVTLVAAVDEAGNLQTYSNRGKKIEIAAVSNNGTSEAGAKVAAVDLGIKHKAPNWSAADVEKFLISTCDVVPTLPIKTHCILNHKYSQDSIVPAPFPSPLPPAQPSSKSKELQAQAKKLIVEKKGSGQLSVNDIDCEPKCIYSPTDKKKKNLRVTAVASNENTKVIPPRQCKASRNKTTPTTRQQRRVSCTLSAKSKGSVVFSFTPTAKS